MSYTKVNNPHLPFITCTTDCDWAYLRGICESGILTFPLTADTQGRGQVRFTPTCGVGAISQGRFIGGDYGRELTAGQGALPDFKPVNNSLWYLDSRSAHLSEKTTPKLTILSGIFYFS